MRRESRSSVITLEPVPFKKDSLAVCLSLGLMVCLDISLLLYYAKKYILLDFTSMLAAPEMTHASVTVTFTE